MAKINVASVQQYTIDRLKVSLTWPFEIVILKELSFQIMRSDGTDCTDRFMTISESNPWQYTDEDSLFYIYLKKNSHIESGDYTFILLNKSEEIYRSNLFLHYMEDVRVEFSSIELKSLNTLHVGLKPIDSDNPAYQTKEMLRLMNFSIIDSVNGAFYSENFDTLSSVIESIEDPVTGFDLKLRSGKPLPSGDYDIRLTSVYKSRTFSVVEKRNVPIPFMTTTPPSIGSSYITKNALGETVLHVVFDKFIEKGMLNSGRRQILTSDGRDITSWFDADRVSATSYSLAGISYISRIEIPLMTEFYALKKGDYTIKWTWDSIIIPDLSFTFNTAWIVNPVSNISTFRVSFIDIDLPVDVYTEDLNTQWKYLVEYHGTEMTGAGRDELFGDLYTASEFKYGNSVEKTNQIGVPIIDFTKLKRGTYTFIIYHESNNARVYDYMGDIDIIESFNPTISMVTQTNIDTLTVTLTEQRPIEVIEQYIPKLTNPYGSIDFSSRLLSTKDSNVWEAQQYLTDTFDIKINDSSNLTSGSYSLKLVYKDEEVTNKNVSIQYMESRKGAIIDISQISISSIRITFSEPQTRQFLLSTTLNVERRVDGADYTDRFELLENVLKADQSIFQYIDLPMDHEDSFPAGRYRVSFLFEREGAAPQIIYAYDAELGFMTNNLPYIKSITTNKLSNNILSVHVVFGNYLESYLFNNAVFAVDRFDGVDVAYDFTDKNTMNDTKWDLETSLLRGITYIKGVKFQTKSSDVIIERGIYSIEFSWPSVAYLEPIKKQVFLEYQLPLLKYAEVSNVNTANNWARIYFKLDEAMQYEYYEHLNVEVLDPNGNDVTSYFDTIQHSNNIDPSLPDEMKLSMDNFNLDVINLEEISFGNYQFIFYHIDGGIRSSHNMYSLEITNASSPRIATAEQVEINKLMITLRNPIPRMLLENFSFTFAGTNLVDHTEKFMSIDSANDWPEDLREVTSFYIQIKSGYYCDEGTYLFTMYNGTVECDGYLFDIERLEGATGEIVSTTPVNLSTLEILFREEESAAIFRSISLQVLDENGNDVSSKFEPLTSATQLVTTDYFDTINLRVNGHVAEGIYQFIFYKIFKNTQRIISENTVNLPYMSNVYPILYQVSATKLGSVMTGDDALIMWFNPPLEKTLFDNATFGLFKTSNTDVELTNKFRPISDAILDTDVVDGITYINTATLEFANKGTLNRDNYTVIYNWSNGYAYMKNLERDIRLDYILFPVKEIEQVKVDELLVTFKSPVSADFLKNSELIVNTTYQKETIDGLVTTEVDFSTQFKSLQETNDFSIANTFETVTLKMGTRDVIEYTITLTEENFNNYLGKRVRLHGETDTEFVTLMNVLDTVVDLTFDNASNYYGRVIQTVGSDHSIIETLTEENAGGYVGEAIKLYKPDPEWVDKEVDIYCNEAESILPEGNYRFIIAETITTQSGSSLQYAYAGDCDINLMVDTELLDSEVTLEQTSYDTLLMAFTKPQLSNILKAMSPDVKYIDESTGDIKDYSGMFKDTTSANAYSTYVIDTAVTLTETNSSIYIGRLVGLETANNDSVFQLTDENYTRYLNKVLNVYKDEMRTGIFEYGVDKDTVINDIHYGIRQVPKAKMVLSSGKFISPHKYNIGFLYKGVEYFSTIMNLPFMTSTPPKISDMEIEDDCLLVKFEPKVELQTFLASSYSIMSNRGMRENEDGTYSIKGVNVSSNFGGVIGAKLTKEAEGDVEFVSEVRLNVNKNAFLASGKYTLTWSWPSASFLPDSVYTGGLNVIAKGIQSVRTTSGDTIEVVLKESVSTSALMNMGLSVRNSSGRNMTSFFKSLEEANPDITSSESTNTFYIQVEDDHDVTSDTYTFTIIEEIIDEDDIEEVPDVEMLSWSMNIVYLSSDFPVINEVNNMSTRKYSIIDMTSSNYLNYLGKMVQLYSSNDASEIQKLTRKNSSTFIDTKVRVFQDARIDQIGIALDKVTDSSLINALQFNIRDSAGNDITENFIQSYENSSFEQINRLRGIFFKFTRFIPGIEIRNFDISVILANGIDITDDFIDIDDANTIDDESTYNQIYFMLNTDSDIHEKDIENLSITIKDSEGYLVENFTYENIFKTSLETKLLDIALASDTTVLPGYYSFDFFYTNEPDIEGSVMIHPFEWNGLLPFFSTNIGSIESVDVVDMETIEISFSNLNLPTALFTHIDFQLVNEDGDVVETEFERISDSNELDGYEEIGDLDIPGIIKLKLKEGEELDSGIYVMQFMIDIDSYFNSDNGDGENTSPVKSQSYPLDQYCLWERTESIPHMFREMTNAITGIEVMGIDRLKITLEKEISTELLKEFNFELYDNTKDVLHTDIFEDIEESNFFGRYIMSSDNRYILYSSDSISWNRFDTGYGYRLTKIFYHESSGYYFVLCSNGKILRFKEFVQATSETEKASKEISYGVDIKKSLNDYLFINDNTLIIVGNDGTILKGTISSTGTVSLTSKSSGTDYTLTSISKDSSGVIYVSGYRGTVLRSTNNGDSWQVIQLGITNNLFDIYCYSATISTENEDPDQEDESDEEDTVITSSANSTELHEYVFVVGTNGTILYSDNGTEFEALPSGISSGLFSITSHEDTIVAVGDNGVALTIQDSEDDLDIVLADSPTKSALRDVEWCNNHFVACGASGIWLTSIKGFTWTLNSSIYSSALKCVDYIESQYKEKKANYFYVKLKAGQEIGPVSFYSGEEIPTLESSFCSSWTSVDQKLQHVNDIYIRTSFDSALYRQISQEYYRFELVKSENMIDDEENIVEVTREFAWVVVSASSIAHNGKFFGRIRMKSEENPENWLYTTENEIELPYMTSNPGNITKVEICSPDDEEGVEFMNPYLRVEMDSVNENSFYYANYQLLDEGGNDYTSYFKSLRLSSPIYSAGLLAKGYYIYGEDNSYHLPAGKYTLVWKWMAIGSDEIRVTDINVKTMARLTSVQSTEKDNINLVFSKPIPRNYFVSDGGSSFNLDFSIRKFPDKEDVEPIDILNSADVSDLNYYGSFKLIGDTSESSQVILSGNNATGVRLKIASDYMSNGSYLIKFNNPDFEYPTVSRENAVKGSNDITWISTAKIDIERPMVNKQPTIESVSMEKYSPIPNTSDGYQHASQVLSGEGSPVDTLAQDYANWTAAGTSTLIYHVGDHYTDSSTGDTYYFNYNKLEGVYEWQKDEQKLYLAISFGEYPIQSLFDQEYIDFELQEIDKETKQVKADLKKDGDVLYWRTPSRNSTGIESTNYWIIDSKKLSDSPIRQISKIYIPLDETVNFPGSNYVLLTMKFKGETDEDSYYKNLTYEGFSLPSAIHSYGDITEVTFFNPDIQEDVTNTEAGLRVIFEREHSKTFIQNLTFSITRTLYREKTVKLTEDNIEEYYGRYAHVFNSEILKKLPSVTWDLSFATAVAVQNYLRERAGTETTVMITELTKDIFIGEKVTVFWHETYDETGRFRSITESNLDIFEDEETDRTNKIQMLLTENQTLDHGLYTISFTGAKLATDLVEAEKIQSRDSSGNLMYDSNGDPIYEDAMIEFTKLVEAPWLTTTPPTKITAKMKSSSKNPYLEITFDAPVALSAIKRKNTKISIHEYSDVGVEKTDLGKLFRKVNHSSTVFHEDENMSIDSEETFIDKIHVMMKSGNALATGTYNVELSFAKKTKLSSIPNVKAYGYSQFTLNEIWVSKIGVISKAVCKDKKLNLTIKKLPAISSNAKLAKSSIGTVLGVKNWTKLIESLDLTIMKKSFDYSSKLQNKYTVSGNKIECTLKKDTAIPPGTYKMAMSLNDHYVVTPKNHEIQGLIWNSVGKADGDPICWIIDETTPDGDKKCRVYKSFSKASKHVKSLKKKNRIAKYQYKLCKKCRNINLLSTRKVKACIEKYDIPYTKDKKFTGISRFFIDLVKKWYKFRTIDAKAAKYKVSVTYTGKYLTNKPELVEDEKHPNKKYTYKCTAKGDNPFPGFKLEKTAPQKGDEDTFNLGCANYVSKNGKYKWNWAIATIADGKYPDADGKAKFYFASIIWKNTELARGFKCNEKGKRTSEYKKYLKSLKKVVKKQKKAIIKCNKCKKHPIAIKGTTNIGWGSALFPIRVRTLDRMKGVPSNLDVANSKGGFKAPPPKKNKKGKLVQKGWGCTNPSFTWAKTTVGKKQYTKLKCRNCNANDSNLSVSSFQAMYHK